jgi:hypothetical protein
MRLIGSFALFAALAAAQTWTEGLILPNTSVSLDWFGSAVAVSADLSTLVATAQYYNSLTLQQIGAAYVFKRDGTQWIERALIEDANAIDYDNLGNAAAVSSDGRIVAVAANAAEVGGNAYQGKVLVLAHDGSAWQQQSLEANDGLANDAFGSSIGMSDDGTRIAVGAQDRTSNSLANNGAVYVFDFSSTWT